MIIKIKDIFTPKKDKRLYTKEELFDLKLGNGFINAMATSLNLNYLESNTYQSNLCFANNRGLRPEFRTVFTKTDVIYYVNAVLQKDYFDIKSDQVPFPNNDTIFWELVKTGSQ